jgi:hypothetical protein
MVQVAKDIWSLVMGPPQIDPDDLAAAVQDQASESNLDYRTRLLLRDSLDALSGYWGAERLGTWLARCPSRDRLERIREEQFEAPGFTLIRRRLVEKTHPQAIQDLLKELGNRIRNSIRLDIGGSAALILPGYVARHTEDIDAARRLQEAVRIAANPFRLPLPTDRMAEPFEVL